ncbi:glycosyltransferase family 4 protein [Psychrobacillus sp. MER TA 171]|mgnify:CR=1 FL=1|uniref:glycosyltransferase family 4 protein n=1 Tax=Psychrobacillus sp. MER TA 171 TaxID=2939577 RepID=UPI002040A9B6|nr:glycosyltransferase family 4 protein [Psychrobacillus sp. MER TA 171]MCM3356735.1 glycosyltransferase family 4 protein [Psychrobacillus sp. MER TA 171]
MRIVYLCQHFPPETGAPQIRVYEVSKELLAQGHDIQVVTAFPHHPHGIIPDEYKGKKYEFEKWDDIPVHRTWIYPSKKGSFWKRLISYFSFTFSSFFGLMKTGKVDVIIVNSPPIFLGLTGLIGAKLKGAKFVFNVADVWPESAVKLGLVKNKMFIKLAEILESFLYKHSWKIATATDGIKSYIINHSQPEEKVFVLPNGVNTKFFYPQEKNEEYVEKFGLQGKFVFAYGGNLGYAQGLEFILYAAKKMQETVPHAHFLIAGAGPEEEKLHKLKEELGLQNTTFLGHLPLKEMPKLFSVTDVSIVPLRDIQLFEGARPSKIFPAAASGVPVLYCGKGESAKIITENNIGLVAQPENVDSMSEKMFEFVEMKVNDRKAMEENGRRLAEDEYSWTTIVNDLLQNITQK